MPWPEAHRARTRERILAAAAAAIRANGVGELGVADVMRRAGLTHGGFYAHFASKDELVSAALAHASGETVRTFERAGSDVDVSDRLKAVIDMYLSPAHLAHPERGCTIAALGPEAARGGAKVRRGLRAAIRARLDVIRRLLPGPSSERRRREAAGVFACLVGGMILARGLGDTEGTRLLDDCRAFLKDALE